MNILLITDEEWNDAVYGNNVLTNWFSGFDAAFAQIYCSPGQPFNSICERYFQITDSQMVRSLMPGGQKAGSRVSMPETSEAIESSKKNAQRQGYYKWLKQLSTYIHTPMMMVRDAIWRCGRYNTTALRSFVEDFNPDIVYCPRMITPKLMRLEKLVASMTSAPFVAFTADNEASLHHYSWSPLYWLRCLMIHNAFKKHVKLYRHYFMFSEDQATEYNRNYNLPTSCLYKSGTFSKAFVPKDTLSPIRMVYAGRLYCGRWKTLAAIGDALVKINKEGRKIFLDVYTTEQLSKKQTGALSENKYIYVHAPIPPKQLAEEYGKADIALHVESFDKKNRYATHYSFSTKIIDLMASTCAIMAICWDKHTGYKYLQQHDAAICISSEEKIYPNLLRLVQHPAIIEDYARKAWLCGVNNHNKDKIQNQIKQTFERITTQNIC